MPDLPDSPNFHQVSGFVSLQLTSSYLHLACPLHHDCMTLMMFLLLQGTMALIKFDTMLDNLQSHHSLLSELLSGQEGLHYGDMHYMPLLHMLKMQQVPYNYFVNLVWENNFQLVQTTMANASNITTILLVFASDDQLKTIKYIHIRLVVHHASCQLYKLRSIPCFMQSIIDELKRTREK